MMEMTIAVMKAAPVGVFCLIAKTFAGIGFDAFVPMLKYMGVSFWRWQYSVSWYIRSAVCVHPLESF